MLEVGKPVSKSSEVKRGCLAYSVAMVYEKMVKTVTKTILGVAPVTVCSPEDCKSIFSDSLIS